MLMTAVSITAARCRKYTLRHQNKLRGTDGALVQVGVSSFRGIFFYSILFTFGVYALFGGVEIGFATVSICIDTRGEALFRL